MVFKRPKTDLRSKALFQKRDSIIDETETELDKENSRLETQKDTPSIGGDQNQNSSGFLSKSKSIQKVKSNIVKAVKLLVKQCPGTVLTAALLLLIKRC